MSGSTPVPLSATTTAVFSQAPVSFSKTAIFDAPFSIGLSTMSLTAVRMLYGYPAIATAIRAGDGGVDLRFDSVVFFCGCAPFDRVGAKVGRGLVCILRSF